MTQLINNLKATIEDSFQIKCKFNTIEICESQVDSKCKKVEFEVGSKENSFAYTLDIRRDVFPFYASINGLKKVNDATLVYKQGAEFFVLLIEMKSNNTGEYLKQLKSGRNFINFVIETININFGKSYTLKEENIRCVLFDVRRIPTKTGTKRENIKFENRNGLNVVNQECNEKYFLVKYFLPL
jgi:hypothetical protein